MYPTHSGPGKFFIAALLILFAACTRQAAEARQAPSFSLPQVGGGTLDSAAYAGQVLYVDFWASWCKPCVDAIPELNALQKRFSARGFSVLGISIDDLSIEEIAAFAADKGVAYPVALGDENLLDRFGPTPGLPTGFLVDREGKIVRMFVGALPASRLEAAIEAQLVREAAAVGAPEGNAGK